MSRDGRHTRLHTDVHYSFPCLLDLPDGILQDVMLLAELQAACRLGCTCQRLQSIYTEQSHQRIAALARAGPPHFQLVLKLPGGSSTSKGAAEPLSMDIAKMFEILPSDAGLLFDAKAGQGYCGDATLDVCKNLSSYNLKRVIQNYAWREYGKAASVLRAVWPTYQEVEEAPRAAAPDNNPGLTWSMAVQRVARCCGSRPCHVSIKVDMTGIDTGLVKCLLSTIGDCGVELALRALGLKELPFGTPQDWKRVQTSGNRRRLCTFYLLKYRGLRILVTCDPLPIGRVQG